MQEAYQVQASLNENFSNLLWDSGKVQSDQSHRVLYAGPELKSMDQIFWRVKVWSNRGEESEFSHIAFFEMGPTADFGLESQVD